MYIWWLTLAPLLGMILLWQVMIVFKIIHLRKRFGSRPHLERQPAVRRWMVFARLTTLGVVVTSIALSVLADEPMIMAIAAGVSALLFILTATLADNSTEPGDGDSGG